MNKLGLLNKKKLFFWSILTIIYFIRLIYIDSDIRAPWGVLNYQPFDEGCYGALALHKIDFNTINPNNFYKGSYEYLMAPHVINNLVGNVFSYFTLIIFGDNYLGFRLGSIIAGYIITVLFVLTLKELIYIYKKENDSKAWFAMFFFIIYLTFNFVFYNASRIVEPTLYRLLFLQIITFIFIKRSFSDNIKNFLLGFLSVLSVFFVYITNLFIGVSIIVTLLFYIFNYEMKKAKQYCIFCFCGGLVAYIISFIYYYFFWNTTPIKNALDAIFTFQSVPGYSVTEVSLYDKILNFFSSNIFLYNPILIVLLFFALPYFLSEVFCRKNKEILFLLSLILGLFFQTLLSEDYIVRKSLVIFPTMIYLIFIYIIMDKNKINKYKINQKCMAMLCKYFFLFSKLFLIITLLYCAKYRLIYIENGTNLDFSKIDSILVYGLTVISILYILFNSIFYKYNKYPVRLLYFCLLGVLLINCTFIFKYNFYKNTFSDKEIMQQLGKIADNKIVCFSYDNSNTLYNNILPLMCPEDQILEYMKKNPDIYYYGFEDFQTFNSDKNSLNQHVEICYRFEREFETFGIKRSFALFRYKE